MLSILAKTVSSFRIIFLGAVLSLLVVCVGAVRGESQPVILAFGDSLTAGFGVREEESYPSVLQEILAREGYVYKMINAGVSGDTTAGGVRRVSWALKHEPEIVILELGANDGLRGLSLDEMHVNLEKIILVCRERGAKVLLVGMKIPPNYGEAYSLEFEQVFARLAKQYQLPFMPFFLEGVAAERKYTQDDGIHPRGPGYKIVGQQVWQHLKPMLSQSSR